MPGGMSVRVVSNKLPAYLQKVKAVDAIVGKHAHNIQAAWQAHVPVRTGTYRRSIHVVKVGPSSYLIVAGVFYAIYVELGTHRTPARPAAVPAFEAEIPIMMAEIHNSLSAA